MATPNTSISQLGLSDVNVEYNFTANTSRAFNDVFFRNLTGDRTKLIAGSPINISDVSDKAAFDGILGIVADDKKDFGVVTAQVTLSTDSDILSPDVAWSYSVVSGTGNIVFQPDGGKNATIKLVSDAPGVQHCNVAVTANLSFQGHYVGGATQYVDLKTEVYNSILQVAGTLVVNNSGFVAQSAVTQVTASSNVVGGFIRFSTSPPFGGIVSGNTISFSASAAVPGVDNNNIYTLTTDVLYQNNVIASNTVTVNLRAVYLQQDLNVTYPVSTNNMFANTGPIDSSIKFSATHAIPGANLVWSFSTVSGDTPSLTIAADKASANLYLPVTTFGAKKAVVDVKASLQYANGYILNEKTNRVTLRTVGYGLKFTAAPDSTSQGYGAQTATSVASATYQAGSFSWDYSSTSGASANVTQSVGQSSATFMMDVTAYSPLVNTAVMRVTPVIKFDGIVISNTSSITTLIAEYTGYTFSIDGPDANTQVDDSIPVQSSLRNDANHTVSNGYVTWNVTGDASITSNTSSANLYISTSTIKNSTLSLSGKLYDQYGRFVQEKLKTITLRAFAPGISFAGANNVAKTGYSSPQSIDTTITATCATAGANTFGISTALIGGTSIVQNHYAGNTSYDRVNFTATATGVGVVTGTYRVTASVNYFGVSYNKYIDVTATASLLDSGYSLSTANGVVSSLLPPVTSQADVYASFNVPGGYIQWSRVITTGTVYDTPVANNSLYRFRMQRGTYGSSTTAMNVTGTLLDSNGLVVKSITVPVQATAVVTDPQLAISGSTTVNASNTFQATAATLLTASVNGAVTGESYQFSASRVSGSTAAVSTNPTQIYLAIQANGVENLSSVYDITTNCVISGQIVASKVTRVTLNASALSPSIGWSANDGSAGDFNFPVYAQGQASATMSPAGGTIQWSASYVSGNGLAVNNTTNQLTLTAGQSDIGLVRGTYDVTATYKTPAGYVITTRTARITVSAERYNPGFAWNVTSGNPAIQTGWEETIVAQGRCDAYANSSLTGHTFNISYAKVSGQNADFSSSPSIGFLNLTSSRTGNGLSPRTAVYNMTCSLQKGGQTLAGPFTRQVTMTTVPYYMTFDPYNPSDVSYDQNSVAATSVRSNHEAFPGSAIAWTNSKVSGTGTQDFNYGNDGGNNNRIYASTPPPPGIGVRDANYVVTAYFYANGANRTLSTNMYTSAERTYNSGSCVTEDMWLDATTRAIDAKVGQLYMTWAPEDGFRYVEIDRVGEPELQECYRIETKSGAVLTCSKTTPFNHEESKSDLDMCFYPEELEGATVLVDNYGEVFWDEVVLVENIGMKRVVPISIGGRSFAAGASRLATIYSHNLQFKPIP